jgi:hydroxymethylbilane synthase
VGTRGSKLALAQTELVAASLRAAHPGLEVETVVISTAGDKDQASSLSSGEGVGWFTSALQEALLRGDADFAVHSYKDLPTKQPEGLVVAAVPTREDPRDALVSQGDIALADLRERAVVGTSSARREAQLRVLRPDVDIRPIRGNVDTRLAKLDAGDYDAIVLAFAGLKRLGLAARASYVLSFDEMLPAPAQGALALECRASDTATRALLAAVDDPESRTAVDAERAFLAALEAGCSVPAAAWARLEGGSLRVDGFMASDAGPVRDSVSGAPGDAARLGRTLAALLLQASGRR